MILLLHTGIMPTSPDRISCFTDVWTYYLSRELRRHINTDVRQIPSCRNEQDLAQWFDKLDVEPYRAVIALGLRYFSTVSKHIGEDLRQRLHPRAFLCQIHDGSRLDNDPVDITFTIKDETDRYPFGSDANRYVRHHANNVYVGWAADAELNQPEQRADTLGILVDHTNYGPNVRDQTRDVLLSIKNFVEQRSWYPRWSSVSVRRFDSGRVVDVDFQRIDKIKRYDRTAIPLSEICREHRAAHVFCVTHPESVGQVVLETAMCGTLSVIPSGFVPQDRLDTVRHLQYQEQIPWPQVMDSIDIAASRDIAIKNSWEQVAKRIRSELSIRSRIRGLDD